MTLPGQITNPHVIFQQTADRSVTTRAPKRKDASFTPSSYTLMSRLQHSSLRGCESMYQQFSHNPFITTGEVTRRYCDSTPQDTSISKVRLKKETGVDLSPT